MNLKTRVLFLSLLLGLLLVSAATLLRREKEGPMAPFPVVDLAEKLSVNQLAARFTNGSIILPT